MVISEKRLKDAGFIMVVEKDKTGLVVIYIYPIEPQDVTDFLMTGYGIERWQAYEVQCQIQNFQIWNVVSKG